MEYIPEDTYVHAKESYEALEYNNSMTSFGMGGKVYHWESMFCYK